MGDGPRLTRCETVYAGRRIALELRHVRGSDGREAVREIVRHRGSVAILAFPEPGKVLLERNWREQAEKRGYLVIAPAAPEGDLFFEGGARVFPEFLAKILADYKIGGGGRRAPVRRIRRRAARLRQIGAEAPFLRGRKVVYSPAYAFPRAVPVRFDGVGTT